MAVNMKESPICYKCKARLTRVEWSDPDFRPITVCADCCDECSKMPELAHQRIIVLNKAEKK